MEKNIFFGENLNYLRQKKSLTLQEISDLLGFSRSQWNNYECKTSYPKFLDLIKISKYFDISETDLIHCDLRNSAGTVTKVVKNEIPKEFIDLLEERRYTIELQKEKIASLEQKLSQLKQYPISKPDIKLVAEEKPPELEK